MLTAFVVNLQEKREANEVEKDDAPFLCPACGSDVILRQGTIKIHHFAHKPPVTCSYGKGETEEHRRAKKGIAETLRKQGVANVELEKRIGNSIADVYCEMADGKKVAIEVQISKLTMREIADRTWAYQVQGVFVLWLVPWNPNLNERKYSPKQYEKWLHILNYGRVYYLYEGFTVIPYHFGEFMRHIPQTEFGGGYDKKSMRWVTPHRCPANEASLTSLDHYVLKPIFNARSIDGFSIPKCNILLDKLTKWW